MKGSVFLIPSYLSESNDANFIAPSVKDIVSKTSHYLVENVRTSRRYISSLKLGLDISSLQFEVMDKQTTTQKLPKIIEVLNEGNDIGVISEAGLPGLADPGNVMVSWAHKNKIQVIPLPGTSSIQMALIASGFNGQKFTFNGYLPIGNQDRSKKITQLAGEANRTGFTQIFMETPFRNNQLLEAIVGVCNPNQLLSVATDISGEQEFIATQTIGEWKKALPNLHKIPAIFSFGTYPE